MSDENAPFWLKLVHPVSDGLYYNVGVPLHATDGARPNDRFVVTFFSGGSQRERYDNVPSNNATIFESFFVSPYVDKINVHSHNTLDSAQQSIRVKHTNPTFAQKQYAGTFPGRISIIGRIPLNAPMTSLPEGHEYYVNIYTIPSMVFLKTVYMGRTPTFDVSLDIPNNGENKYAAQFFVKGIYSSDYSDRFSLFGLGKPVIYRPTDGVVDATPTITGAAGLPGAKIRIFETGRENLILGEGDVAAGGTWAAKITVPLQSASVNLTCHQILLAARSEYAIAQEFVVLLAPKITQSAVVNMLATIAGTHTTGVAGIQVDIHRDLDKVKIGQGTTSKDGTWEVTITTALEPGVRAVTARLAYYTQFSIFSDPVNLRVRPYPPVINQVVFYITKTAFKGSALPGATVDIEHANAKLYTTGLVNENGFFETDAITVSPGQKGSGWRVRQKIRNGAEWIYSLDQPAMPDFTVPMLPPTVSKPTLNGQIPTVTGRGNIWEGLDKAKIKVDLINGDTTITLPVATVTADGTWEVKGTEAVAPGDYRVKVWQVLNDVKSAPVELTDNLVIKPLAPADVDVVADGLTATFSGSCWPKASITLLFKVEGEDKQTPIEVDETPGGTWTSLPITFVPGAYTFTVTQTFNGQTSNAVGPVPFNIATPRADIKVPADQQETDLQPEISGDNGYRDAINNKGATIQVFSNTVAGPALGETIVTAKEWVVKLNKSLPVGPHDIYALQTFNEQPSQRSVSVRFNARVPKPLLTVPDPAYFPRRSKFSGRGWPGASITLYFNNVLYPITGGIEVDKDGNWKAEVFLPEVGVKKVVVMQSYGGGERESDEYEIITSTNPPLIESPKEGELVNPAQVVVSGGGFPGDKVFVRRKGFTAVLGTFWVGPLGLWSGKLAVPLAGESPFSFEAQSERMPVSGDPSEAAVIELLDLASPIFIHPSTGDVLVSRLVYSGEGLPGAQIRVADIYNPETLLAPVATVNARGQWIAMGDTDFAAGPQWVIAQQTLGGKKSPWVRSGRFIIEEPPSGFSAPTVDRPWPGEQVGREPMLAGSGQVGAVVYVRQNGKDLCHARVSEDGRWSTRLPERAVGNQTLTVLQARYGVWSTELKPDPTFEVIQVSAGFAAPTIDSPVAGATVDTRFWMSGKGMPGAVIDVRNFYNGAIRYAEATVDAYGNWRVCLSQTVAVGDFTFTAIQTMDGQRSQYSPGVTIKVTDDLPAPTLESHPNGGQIAPMTAMHGCGFPGAKIQVRDVNDGNFVLCEAVVDDFGYWKSMTKNLPLRLIRATAWQVLSPKPNSPWMSELRFTVVNAG